MRENPLFYKQIVPLNREKHLHFKLDNGQCRFRFAADAYMIPAVTEEFALGGRDLPIVFLPGLTHPTAVFLLGLQPGDNLFVDAEGAWTGGYVPAFARRYPFILGEVADADPLMCFDEAYEGLSDNVEGGVDLFVNGGDESPTLQNAIQLVNDYRVAADRTEAFCAALHDFGLLKSITINVQAPGHDNHVVHGLMVIDLDKLNELGDDDFLAFRHAGHLPYIYAHLASLAGIERLGAASARDSGPKTHAISH